MTKVFFHFDAIVVMRHKSFKSETAVSQGWKVEVSQ